MSRSFPPLSPEESRLLRIINAKLGRRAKGLIRDAWETGIYDARLVYAENDESTLQRLRNTHGPAWLHRTVLARA
jgi:hypothetical protein